MKIDIYDFIAWSFDFEGHIGIGRQTRENDIFTYKVQMSIWNTSKELLETFKNKIKFGKVTGPHKRTNKIHKDKYMLGLNTIEIRKHLPLITPYLNLKWRQGELALEALSILKGIKISSKLTRQERKEIYTWEEFLILESCYQECKELNKRGLIIQ